MKKYKKQSTSSKQQFNILISWRLLEKYINKYKKVFKANNIKYKLITPQQYLKEKELINIIHDYDGIICGDDEITKKVIDKAKKLKVVSKWGTGIDSIDKNYLQQKNISIFNSPGAFTKSVAQHGIALMFALTRNIVTNNNDIKNGFWTKRICHNIENKTIGIIGFGKIGKEIYKQLKSFGSNFLFNDIKKNKNFTSLKYLLKKSDIVFISCDLNKTSRNLIRYKELILMKKNSFLVNVSRGAVVNNKDLIKALKNKTIAGAGLDVFENEPINKKSEFISCKNCILTSHNAFNSEISIQLINDKSVENIINFFKTYKK